MRVDPKHLRGFHEVTLSFILVVGAGGLIGAASVSSVWKRPSSVHTVPVFGVVNAAEHGEVSENDVDSVLPGVGERVAVFVSIEKRNSMILFSDVRVVSGLGGVNELDLTANQMEILQFARRHGSLSYRLIPGNEVSPYSGQDVGRIEDLEHIVRR
jgi:hypothetical protein